MEEMMMTQTNPLVTQSSPRSSQTLRLTFAYNGNEVRLLRSQRVAMIAPPSVTAPPEKGQSGYWFEVRGDKGVLLYHRVVHEPIRTDVEVFSDDPKQSITRVPKAKPQGQFTLLVPDLPEAHSFHFFGTPPGAKQRSAPARELVAHSFEELRRFRTTGSDDAKRQGGGEA
jgi:hypothetical protein